MGYLVGGASATVTPERKAELRGMLSAYIDKAAERVGHRDTDTAGEVMYALEELRSEQPGGRFAMDTSDRIQELMGFAEDRASIGEYAAEMWANGLGYKGGTRSRLVFEDWLHNVLDKSVEVKLMEEFDRQVPHRRFLVLKHIERAHGISQLRDCLTKPPLTQRDWVVQWKREREMLDFLGTGTLPKFKPWDTSQHRDNAFDLFIVDGDQSHISDKALDDELAARLVFTVVQEIAMYCSLPEGTLDERTVRKNQSLYEWLRQKEEDPSRAAVARVVRIFAQDPDVFQDMPQELKQLLQVTPESTGAHLQRFRLMAHVVGAAIRARENSCLRFFRTLLLEPEQLLGGDCWLPTMDQDHRAEANRFLGTGSFAYGGNFDRAWWQCECGVSVPIDNCTRPVELQDCKKCWRKVGGKSHAPVLNVENLPPNTDVRQLIDQVEKGGKWVGDNRAAGPVNTSGSGTRADPRPGSETYVGWLCLTSESPDAYQNLFDILNGFSWEKGGRTYRLIASQFVRLAGGDLSPPGYSLSGFENAAGEWLTQVDSIRGLSVPVITAIRICMHSIMVVGSGCNSADEFYRKLREMTINYNKSHKPVQSKNAYEKEELEKMARYSEHGFLCKQFLRDWSVLGDRTGLQGEHAIMLLHKSVCDLEADPQTATSWGAVMDANNRNRLEITLSNAMGTLQERNRAKRITELEEKWLSERQNDGPFIQRIRETGLTFNAWPVQERNEERPRMWLFRQTLSASLLEARVEMLRSSSAEQALEPLTTFLCSSSKQTVYPGLRQAPGAFRWVASVMQLFNRNRTAAQAQTPIGEIIRQLEECGEASASRDFEAYAHAFEAAVSVASFLDENSPGGTAPFQCGDRQTETGIPYKVDLDSPVAWCIPVKERHAGKSISHRQGAVCARLLAKLIEEHNALVILAYMLNTGDNREDALTILRQTQVQSALLSEGDAFSMTRDEMLDFARKECATYSSEDGGNVKPDLEKLNGFLMENLSDRPLIRCETLMLEGEEKIEVDTWCWFKGETAELLREAFLKPIPEALRQQLEEDFKSRPDVKADILDSMELCVKFLTAGQQAASPELCNASLVQYMRQTYDLELPSTTPASLAGLKMQHIGRLITLLSTGTDDDIVDTIADQFQKGLADADKAMWVDMLRKISAENNRNLVLLRAAMIEVAADHMTAAGSGVDPDSTVFMSIAYLPLTCLDDDTLSDLDWFNQEFGQHFLCSQYASLLRAMADV